MCGVLQYNERKSYIFYVWKILGSCSGREYYILCFSVYKDVGKDFIFVIYFSFLSYIVLFSIHMVMRMAAGS